MKKKRRHIINNIIESKTCKLYADGDKNDVKAWDINEDDKWKTKRRNYRGICMEKRKNVLLSLFVLSLDKSLPGIKKTERKLAGTDRGIQMVQGNEENVGRTDEGILKRGEIGRISWVTVRRYNIRALNVTLRFPLPVIFFLHDFQITRFSTVHL